MASTVPEVPTKGSCGSLRLHILPAPGWVLKARAPFHGRVQAPAEVQVGNKLLSIHNVIDLRETHRTVAVPACFTAVGTFTASWDLEFFLCTDYTCELQHTSWDAAVQIASPPVSSS
jgi:hypothetical protein